MRFNTNNYWTREGRQRPNDYDYRVWELNATKNWIDLFHANKYKMIRIPKEEMWWLRDAFRIGSVTCEFPIAYEEELNAFCDTISPEIFESFGPDGCFVRTDHASLKRGKYGVGPYKSLKDIITGIITSTFRHACFEYFNKSEDGINVYLLPWKNLCRDKEFRVTAISQQAYQQKNKWLSSMTGREITHFVECFLVYFYTEVKPPRNIHYRHMSD